MSDWTPDSDGTPADDHDEPEQADGERGVARVMTLAPVALRLVPTPHPRTPAGHTVFRAVAAIDGDVSDESPVLAQGSLPTATFDAAQSVGLFEQPAPLILTARE
ncbi:MAG TPA: hypothetical protein VFV33_07765, partial [Gemmatimonadaceae bacterium]|nr:hypothetical protein [Gemmatimonadaceae bacterium]